ncbi:MULTISPECIES: hypothetical protein [unclassified Mesorhizobium]|uniref:hypothetical protein n=1 Tax=unclassified Mesorhizobium TaxID=325217 RepID=UPI00109384F1|nr:MULTISPECIES: hypothetical protein [unclassified Mesorhizobium]TGS46283.1 hypothetical protein EN825_11780 [Mesorhizobium sp. M8A.F.Ca.ET.182.01.1.1]TGS81741.1 hypothetical protein EN824_12010 [Mesorhizobium sp. M8A.F.Ca.ET.181.01.1.1]
MPSAPPEDLPDIDPISSMTFGAVSFEASMSDFGPIAQSFAPYDPIRLAATFGGLLTLPELQANNHRIEVLTHLALLTARGKRKPDDHVIAQAFKAIGETKIGQQEDPAEDVFVSSVYTSLGNFRVLGGSWESGGFYLQRLINTLERLGPGDFLSSVRNSVYALLRLSDAICERAELSRHQLGAEIPLKELPARIRRLSGGARKTVCFTPAQLADLDISLNDLAPFGFTPRKLQDLVKDMLGHTQLERFPLVHRAGVICVLLPSAVSAAARRFVLEEMSAAGVMQAFMAAMAHEYTSLISDTPLLGDIGSQPIELRRTDGGFMAGTMTEIDLGLYLNFIFFTDDLDGFASKGLLGFFPPTGKLSATVDKWIDDSRAAAMVRPGFRAGLSLLVPCGIGRGVKQFIADTPRDNWHWDLVSAPDLLTMSWLLDFKPLSLWRMLEAEGRLQELGVHLQNINGLLNMVGWTRSLGGHLVPHGALPDNFGAPEQTSIVMIQQNSLRIVRGQALINWDAHVVKGMAGSWLLVRRDRQSLFEEDRQHPLYVVDERNSGKWPDLVYKARQRDWWCSLTTSSGTSGHFAYERFRVLKTWLTRIAPILDSELQGLPPRPVCWNVIFEGDIGHHPAELGVVRLSFEDALAALSVEVSQEECTVTVTAKAEFEMTFLHPENIAERALVEKTLQGFQELSGVGRDVSKFAELMKRIVPDGNARQQHAFMARRFRDWVRNSLWSAPITVDADDSAYIKLGLGWKSRDRSEGGEISGKGECNAFLNRAVKGLEDEVCNELRQLDRRAVIQFALTNHESAIVDRDQWQATAAAVLSLHNDREEALGVMAHRDFQLSAVLQSSRLIVEFALCECPIAGGRKPGQLEMSRLMAKVLMIANLGGWSDAIRWDAMEPQVHITALGDIHANLSFQEDILAPYARAASDLRVQDSVETYSENLQDPPMEAAPLNQFPDEFWEAWREQFGASFEASREFLGMIENRGIDAREAIFSMKKSELLAACNGVSVLQDEAGPLVNGLLFVGRPKWRDLPPGLDPKDIFPWRFRRRLSVLRRPIIQLDDQEDPELIIAPGLVGDAVQYMLGNYHRGDFPLWQLTPKMKQWAGRSRDLQGHEFAMSVATRMRELGWETDIEVPITKLLRKGFPKNYGDVDVLAWRPDNGRLLIMECKDVQYRKTDGEIAEQLADFRGLATPDGKRDLLRKHLDRVELIQSHIQELKASLRLSIDPLVEGHLIFKNAVPMQFAWEQMRGKTALNIFSDLGRL